MATTKAIKNTKSNVPTRKSTKYQSDGNGKRTAWIDEYIDCFSLTMHPVTEAFIDRFSADLIAWSKKDDSLVMKDFCIEKGMPQSVFYSYVAKYPKLKIANEFAKMCVASRREKGGLTNRLNAGMVTLSMPIYDSEWKDLLEWKAKMAEKNTAPSTVIVQMEPFKEE